MNVPQKHYAEQNESDTKKYPVYDFIYTKY